MTWLYLDLDGPLLDVSDRYHRVHCEIVRSLGGEPRLDRIAYWARKRDAQGAAALAAAEGLAEEARRYLERWLDRIETDDALAWDALQPDAPTVLATLAARRRVALVTLRQNRAGLERELDRFEIRSHLEAVLSASPVGVHGARTKQALISDSGLPTDGAWLVGDTEIDVRAARLLGIRAAAVTCGIRSEARLRRESPDLIVPDLVSAVDTLLA